MRPETTATVSGWWAELFDVASADLWSGTTVRRHTAVLADYPGWWAAWTDTGGHVSAPADVDLPPATADLRSPAFWTTFATERGLTHLGPSVHAYLDVDPGTSSDVEDVRLSDLRGLRRRVDPAEWWESGWGAGSLIGLGVRRGGRVVAAAHLSAWTGKPLDVGLVVDPAWRGRGLGLEVGRAAASLAVRTYGLARWRALETNEASRTIADRLGFEPLCRQVAVRP